MKKFKLIKQILLSGIIGLVTSSTLAEGARVTPLIQKTLHGMGGKEGVMLTVDYAPGASSKKHRHNAHTFVYVLEGAVVMQVSGSEPATVNAGSTFYESPEEIHLVSKNASETEAAKFLVFTVKEKGSPVVITVP